MGSRDRVPKNPLTAHTPQQPTIYIKSYLVCLLVTLFVNKVLRIFSLELRADCRRSCNRFYFVVVLVVVVLHAASFGRKVENNFKAFVDPKSLFAPFQAQMDLHK